MRGNQYSCGFQRMLRYWRLLAKVGSVESLTLYLSNSSSLAEADDPIRD